LSKLLSAIVSLSLPVRQTGLAKVDSLIVNISTGSI